MKSCDVSCSWQQLSTQSLIGCSRTRRPGWKGSVFTHEAVKLSVGPLSPASSWVVTDAAHLFLQVNHVSPSAPPWEPTSVQRHLYVRLPAHLLPLRPLRLWLDRGGQSAAALLPLPVAAWTGQDLQRYHSAHVLPHRGPGGLDSSVGNQRQRIRRQHQRRRVHGDQFSRILRRNLRLQQLLHDAYVGQGSHDGHVRHQLHRVLGLPGMELLANADLAWLQVLPHRVHLWHHPSDPPGESSHRSSISFEDVWDFMWLLAVRHNSKGV